MFQPSIDRLLKAQRASRTSVEIFIQNEMRMPKRSIDYDQRVRLLIGAASKARELEAYLQAEDLEFSKSSEDRVEVQLSLREMINLLMEFDPYDYDSNLLFHENYRVFMLTLG